MHFFKKILLSIVCILWLAGCGFHLRGVQHFEPKLKTLYVKSQYPFDPFSKFIKEGFTESHIIVVDEPAAADLILNIVSETKEQPMATVGSSQQVRQYTLYYIVTFQLEDKMGKIIYGPEQVSEQRSQIVQPSQVLSDSNETNQLYQIMYREAANDALGVLSSTDASKAIYKTLTPKKSKEEKIPRSSRGMTSSNNTSSSSTEQNNTSPSGQNNTPPSGQNNTLSSRDLIAGSSPNSSTESTPTDSIPLPPPPKKIDPKNFSVNDLPAEQQASPATPQNAPTEAELSDLK